MIKEVIDKHILYTDIPPHEKGQMWVVAYLQRIKVLLQNNIFIQEQGQHMRNVEEGYAQASYKTI